MLFTWKRFLAKLRSPARKPCRRPRVVLRAEQLEDRLAPAVITVTSLDEGAGTFTGSTDSTLRGAIANAASGDTIVFQAGLTGTMACRLSAIPRLARPPSPSTIH